MIKPYYQDEWVTIYHGDCREILPQLDVKVDLVLTDPPYGNNYKSGHEGTLPREIFGNRDTELRDWMIALLGDIPALIFGTWKIQRPKETRALLIWDTLGALGMGDLSIPWKPSHQEIYVIGRGFEGKRTSDVLSYPPVQSSAWRGRKHPHEKPVPLLKDLLQKSPAGLTLDPFMGVGSTLVACIELNRKCIGIEIEEKYCEIAANRCSQGVFDFSH